MKYISVTEFLRTFPEYHSMGNHQKWHTEQVGHSYDYDESVSRNDLYAFHGVCMELFIRKCLCLKFNIYCEDSRTNKILQQNKFRNGFLYEELREAYEVYADFMNGPFEVIGAIKIVGLSHRLAHGEHMEDFNDSLDMELNISNLKEVKRFVDKLPYQKMAYKQPCDLQFGDNCILRGVPDFIFDGQVFCQIATSMYEQVPPEKFAQVVFYIMGHYGRYDYGAGAVKEFTIIIYNPLLGLTYTTHWKLTPKEFDRMMASVNISMNEMHK